MIMVSISKPYSTLDVPLPSSPRRRKRIFLKTCYAATDHKSNVSGFAQYCLERRDPSPTFHSKTNIRHNILKKTCHQDEENAKPAPVINIGRFSDNTGEERGRGGGRKKKRTRDGSIVSLPRLGNDTCSITEAAKIYFFPFFFPPLFSSTHRIGITGSFHYGAIVSTCCAYGTSFYFGGNDPLSP